MAKTYYKAQPTAAETQINWAEVGKNFSDQLKNEVQQRDEQKAAIDEASRQYQKTLNEVEQGQSATANQWWLGLSSNLQEQMLMQDRLFRTGELGQRQYTLMRQNLTDGTDGMIGLFGKFNLEHKDRMDRFEKGESQDLEQFTMATLESFGNFQKTAAIVNPETGSVSVADVDENGQIIDDPNAIRSVSSLHSLIARRYDKYDIDAAAETFAGQVGVWDTVSRKYGSEFAKGLITKTSEPFFKGFTKEELMALGMSEQDAINTEASTNVYTASEDQFVSDVMSVWTQTSSILTNSMEVSPENGEQYTFTFNEDRKPNEILLRKDEQGQVIAEYTEEQEKGVAQAIRNNVRGRLDKKITTNVVGDVASESASERNLEKTKDVQKDLVGVWSELYYKTGEQKQASLDALLASESALKGGLIDIKISDKGVDFVYTNSAKNRTIAIPENATQEDWIRIGTEIHGIADIDKATLAAGRFPQGAKLRGFTDADGKTITFQAKRQGTAPVEDPIAVTMNAVRSELTAGAFNTTESAVLAKIQPMLTSLGFKAREGGGTRFDILVSNPAIEDSQIWIKSDGGAKTAELLNAWIAGQLTNETADRFVKLNTSGGGELDG